LRAASPTLCRHCVDTVAHPGSSNSRPIPAPTFNKSNQFNALQALTHPRAPLARTLR